MFVLKISTLILCYFFARIALSACEPYASLTKKVEVCWRDDLAALVSQDCMKQTCEARKFFATKIDLPSSKRKKSSNPATHICHLLNLKVQILRDEQNNEQSFCQFQDGSLVDANAIERKFE